MTIYIVHLNGTMAAVESEPIEKNRMNRLAQSEVVAYSLIMASVTATLRQALDRCGESRYAVSKATGIPESTLSRFANGKPLRGENIDKLCDYLGLALTHKPAKRKRR